MQVLKRLVSSLLFLISTSLYATDPVLTIRFNNVETKYTRTDLLKRAQKITVEDDIIYPSRRHYLAIPLKDLLRNIILERSFFIEFKAIDGFASVSSMTRLFNTPNAQAYLAIESDSDPWPTLPNKKTSAGPFALVWVRPKLSDIRPEEWPYQVTEIQILNNLEKRYPRILPSKTFSVSDPIAKGFKVFLQNCFACHTMNMQGSSTMGPDLNLPHGPTEYMNVKFLVKYIRNPQNLRYWPMAQMPAFSESVLSDQEIHDLIEYLKHMSLKKY